MNTTSLLSFRVFRAALLGSIFAAGAHSDLQADEHFFGAVRGAETLPHNHFDAYQFITLRTGKAAGTFRSFDFSTEVEYGVTDKFQIGLAVVNRYFHIRDVPEQTNGDSFLFGGVELSGKYRLLSPFKDPVGLAVRLETGYVIHDDVAGLDEKEFYLAPDLIVQKNFLDDTLIFQANAGVELAWGKKPAEQYNYELALQAATGVTYRFAPHWFIGVESRIRSEFPEFDFGNREHTVVFVGPSLHYGAEKWWANVSWGYQVWGEGVDEPNNGKTYAEEARNEFRFKVGFNF